MGGVVSCPLTQHNSAGWIRFRGQSTTRAAWRWFAAMRRASSQILRVLSSFPSLFRLQRWTELNRSSAGGRRGSGGSCHAWGDARPDRALGCVDCDARFARDRYSYQSHTMRALRAVAYLTNALQVRTLVARHQSSRRPPPRLILEIDLRERLPAGVADDEAALASSADTVAGSSNVVFASRIKNSQGPRIQVSVPRAWLPIGAQMPSHPPF